MEGRKEAVRYYEPTPFEVLGDLDENEPPSSHGASDRWLRMGKLWMRVHLNTRMFLFNPEGVANGPDVSMLKGHRTTHMIYEDGSTETHTDDWRDAPAKSSVS